MLVGEGTPILYLAMRYLQGWLDRRGAVVKAGEPLAEPVRHADPGATQNFNDPPR